MRTRQLVAGLAGALAIGVVATGCGNGDGNGAEGGLSGTIRVDGSSTVAPLTESIAERFQQENPDVRVTVGTSGTGGGFEKFCAGETDLSDASRPIDPDEESSCEREGVEFEEVTVATDALTVVVNPENPVECVTVEQLSAIWGPDSDIDSWSEIPNLDPPYDEELSLYGPGTDSGTFDYFTEAINGEEGFQRKDYNNVGEDDNATVTGVTGDTGGMGYLGYSFYVENQSSLKALAVDSGKGCVEPSVETAQAGEYIPLSRPLLVYPSAKALDEKVVSEFMDYYLDNVNTVAEALGFIPLTDEQLQQSKDAIAKLKN